MSSYTCPQCENQYYVHDANDFSSVELNTPTLLKINDHPRYTLWGTSLVDDCGWTESPFEDGWNGKFVRYDDKDFREEAPRCLKQLAQGKIGFVVSLYRHSMDLWYVSGTRWVPDAQWDVTSYAGFLFPSEEAKAYWRKLSKRKGGQSVKIQAGTWAYDMMDYYTHWVNGWLYNVEFSWCVDGCPNCGRKNRDTRLSGPFFFGASSKDSRESAYSWFAEELAEFERDVVVDAFREEDLKKARGTPNLPGVNWE